MSTTVIYKQEIDSFKLAFLLFSFIFRPNLNNFRVNTNRKMWQDGRRGQKMAHC